jgi:DNA-binding FadR family transcriptional regulator
MATAGAPPGVEEDTGLVVGDDGSGPAAHSADKLASQVARRIEAEVIVLGWPVGKALDSEPVLRERYGISRSLLREAVQLVEHHQVARMRRGPGGGLIVCAPDVGPATRAAVTYLEFSGTNPVDVMRARRLIEPTASRLCAERITEDGITALRGALKAELERDRDPRTWAENPLHVIMCNLAGNPAFDLFVDILNQLSLRYVAAWAPEPANLHRAVASTHRWHGEIVSAAVAGDASRAETRVAEHFAEMAPWTRPARFTVASWTRSGKVTRPWPSTGCGGISAPCRSHAKPGPEHTMLPRWASGRGMVRRSRP